MSSTQHAEQGVCVCEVGEGGSQFKSSICRFFFCFRILLKLFAACTWWKGTTKQKQYSNMLAPVKGEWEREVGRQG